MNKYSLRILNPDAAIAKNEIKIGTPSYPNVAKLGLSTLNTRLEDVKKTQKHNIHSQIGAAERSCGLKVESKDQEPLEVVSERLFQRLGHVDHAKAELTKVFIRDWRNIRSGDHFYCWWCTECGYICETNFPYATSFPDEVLAHECPSAKLKRELLAELKRCLIKPGSKPVVSGAESWNAAINKAIELVGD